MRTFGHLKQLFTDDQLSNFLITLEVCHLRYKFLIKNQSLLQNFVKGFRDIKALGTPYIRGWVTIKALVNFMRD